MVENVNVVIVRSAETKPTKITLAKLPDVKNILGILVNIFNCFLSMTILITAKINAIIM